jgi:hypothetical protein
MTIHGLEYKTKRISTKSYLVGTSFSIYAIVVYCRNSVLHRYLKGEVPKRVTGTRCVVQVTDTIDIMLYNKKSLFYAIEVKYYPEYLE